MPMATLAVQVNGSHTYCLALLLDVQGGHAVHKVCCGHLVSDMGGNGLGLSGMTKRVSVVKQHPGCPHALGILDAHGCMGVLEKYFPTITNTHVHDQASKMPTVAKSLQQKYFPQLHSCIIGWASRTPTATWVNFHNNIGTTKFGIQDTCCNTLGSVAKISDCPSKLQDPGCPPGSWDLDTACHVGI
ncbi:hypothetical protein EDC04DRAFT_2603385 [Pisolithus marmoratus]|nr:hypothetical protein EDC04DRAFT_2603385 [Pisolithus marmoratus]